MYVLEGIEGNPANRDYVKCQITDDFLEVVVHRTQLFPSNLSITEYPPFVSRRITITIILVLVSNH